MPFFSDEAWFHLQKIHKCVKLTKSVMAYMLVEMITRLEAKIEAGSEEMKVDREEMLTHINDR